MTQKILVSALVAGAVAGFLAALLQFGFVIPLLLEGELYESGARVHFADGFIESEAGASPIGWDLGRHGLTVAFNLIAWIGFALILVALMALGARRGIAITPGTGALWGVMAFLAVHLAPAASLPPELPGTTAAEVSSRYVWWAGTIITAALALAALVFRPGLPAVIVAAVLILGPHIIGAPHLDRYFGVAAPELAAQFVSRTLGVAALTWAILGAVAGWMWDRT